MILRRFLRQSCMIIDFRVLKRKFKVSVTFDPIYDYFRVDGLGFYFDVITQPALSLSANNILRDFPCQQTLMCS